MSITDKLIADVNTAFAIRELPTPPEADVLQILSVFEASLIRCGCTDCTTVRQERIALSDHDRTSIARVLHEIVYSPGGNYDRAVPGIQEYMLACAEKVAAALPWLAPHTPTDDEREALWRVIDTERRGWQRMGSGLTGVLAEVILAAGFRRSEVPEPSRPPVYLAADLWQALGAPTSDFDAYYERNGWADTWANVLGAVRDHFGSKCGQDTDGEPCVLTAGHLPPHYGSSDVGSSEPVPVSEPQGEPSEAQKAPEPTAQELVDYIFDPEEDDESNSIRYGLIFEMLADLRARAASAVTEQGEAENHD